MKEKNIGIDDKQYIYNNNWFDNILILILISADEYNNPNLHPEEQDELEISDSNQFSYYLSEVVSYLNHLN